jgi:nucleoside-diphosphate-sugar epimerase
MAVVLTGGTGLVGSAVLRALLAAGHDVTAIVRSDTSATKVSSAGATPVIGDITDTEWLQAQFAAADGAIHTASPGDATSADFDTAVVHAAVSAYSGTGKPFVHTGGVWVYGSGADITEATAKNPPALTAWRPAVEQLLLEADLRGVVIEPAVVYGGGQGLPALLSTPDDDGNIRLVGDGSQHWATVSADQIAALYVLAYENDDARGYYIGANDEHPTVAELGAAAAAGAGTGDVVPETPQASRDRLFAPLVDALLLDQMVGPDTRSRTELGWRPTGPSLVDELSDGSYRPSV